MKNFDLSVVIPTFNRPNLIFNALESLNLQNTSYKFEVIIQDNSSNNLTETKLQKKIHEYNFKIYYEKNNVVLPPIQNWLKGIERTNTENIKILWDDDWLENDAIEIFMSSMKDNNADVVISSAYLISNKIKYRTYSSKKFLLDADYVMDSITELKPRLPLTPSCSLIKKNLLLTAFDINSGLDNCNKKAIGLDFVMNYIGCFIKNKKVIKINNNLVNLYRSNDSITVNTNKFLLLSCYVSAAYNMALKFNYNFSKPQRKNIGMLSYILNKLNMSCVNYLPEGKFNLVYLFLLFKNRVKQRLTMFLTLFYKKRV